MVNQRAAVPLEGLTRPSCEGKDGGGIKKPKLAKISKKHNGHTRGEFLFQSSYFKKRGYF